MNIKITLKDCECNPTISNHRELSEVEHKKKTMIYAPAQRDTNKKTVNKAKIPSNQTNNKLINNDRYRESEKQMLEELRKNGKNHATLDMVQNSNNILQRQNQILQQNQRTLNDMVVSKGKNGQKSRDSEEENATKQIKKALDNIQQEVAQIKKMRNQIVGVAQEFNKNLSSLKDNRNMPNQIPQMSQMNSNLKDLVNISQNHLQGLQNLEALKNLQNFNIEGYTQAIHTIKRQIAQYQKQSENIERQLKIRAAKLQKLEVSPKFDQELYKPYQDHLNNRINSIDLHAIRDKVYEKLGGFDYGKFEYDVGEIMCQAKTDLGNFSLICKQYEIQVPQMKLDLKELKKIDTKAPSVLDEYKAARGIVFADKKQNSQKLANDTGTLSVRENKHSRTDALQEKLKKMQGQSKKPALIQNINSKPIDTSNNVRLIRQTDNKPRTILENENKRQKKEMKQRNRITSKEKKKEDEQFEKYLQNRAKQELEIIYKERKQRLKKMQQQLQETCQQPLTFIELNLNKDVRKKQIEKKQEVEDQYQEEFENQEEDNLKKKQKQQINRFIKKQNSQSGNIKQMGRDILREKLKNILKGKQDIDKRSEIHQPHRNIIQQQISDPNRQIQNMAQGFVNMINNTLTQVNANLAGVIERKVNSGSLEKRRNSSMQRKQAKRIQIPKLQQFKAPPAFNMNINVVPQPQMIYRPQQTQIVYQPQKKIIKQDFDNLRINSEEESFTDLNVSELDDD